MPLLHPRLALRCIAVAALLLSVPSGAAQPVAWTPSGSQFTYADLADLGGAAPIVADVQVRQATRLKPRDAGPLAPGYARFYFEADVLALIRGDQGLPARIRWLADVALDGANRAPKFKKTRLLLLASAVPGRAGELRLVARDAQLAWTPELDRRLRGVLTELTGGDAPPVVTGIGNAFHVPGSLPGESETQIFLTTGDGRPVSLTVLRRPGEQPRWAVALGEMVDEAAGPPTRDTLLWYRLACTLPPALPAEAGASLDPAASAAARDDYALVLAGLGPCARSRQPG